ncbi:hypothetical protein MPL1032_180149 [Mesorhizobium plurifarium]|uniref:Aminotransferase class I/classII large domain-containing protein n=1 Tax=Mesorhizobium plurifarium TaxID=69974 RepID=A0A0K2VTS6_MESPL|nr:hypothetical protein MPL1032_180149 [Mesorhizobium plurifarium]
MNGAPLARYDATLQGLARKDRLRQLAPRAGLDFSSNDYLGLAGCKRLGDAVLAAIARGTPVGATGSRLLRGNAPEHEELEADAAGFFGAERALFFGGGYITNFALLTALPQKGDLLVLDELAHASMHEGARAGRAESVLVAHNDVDAVENAIKRWRAQGGMGCIWIAIESLYSMDGDCALWRALSRSPTGTRRSSLSTRRTPPGCGDWMAAALPSLSRATTTSSRSTHAARRSAAPARWSPDQERCATISSIAPGHSFTPPRLRR